MIILMSLCVQLLLAQQGHNHGGIFLAMTESTAFFEVLCVTATPSVKMSQVGTHKLHYISSVAVVVIIY